MAAPSAISVLVVEGEFTALHKLGFPLPALATMQEAGFSLRDACWDVKKSLSGFSVSFFWPADKVSAVAKAHNPTTKRKRRRRRGTRKICG